MLVVDLLADVRAPSPCFCRPRASPPAQVYECTGSSFARVPRLAESTPDHPQQLFGVAVDCALASQVFRVLTLGRHFASELAAPHFETNPAVGCTTSSSAMRGTHASGVMFRDRVAGVLARRYEGLRADLGSAGEGHTNATAKLNIACNQQPAWSAIPKPCWLQHALVASYGQALNPPTRQCQSARRPRARPPRARPAHPR
jgi:hypothetical protein